MGASNSGCSEVAVMGTVNWRQRMDFPRLARQSVGNDQGPQFLTVSILQQSCWSMSMTSSCLSPSMGSQRAKRRPLCCLGSSFKSSQLTMPIHSKRNVNSLYRCSEDGLSSWPLSLQPSRGLTCVVYLGNQLWFSTDPSSHSPLFNRSWPLRSWTSYIMAAF